MADTPLDIHFLYALYTRIRTEVFLSDKKAMTLVLSEREMDLLDRLANEKGLSKTALIKQSIRLYQSMAHRIDQGEKLFFEHPATKEKSELMVL